MKKLGLISLLLIPLWTMALPPNTIVFKTNLVMSAKSIQQELNPQNQEFMTLADRVSGTLSNVSIQNTGGAPITVTGIYIFTLTSAPTDCTTGTLLDSPGNPYGALWAPQITIPNTNDNTKQIGANYLYNMIMLFLYGAYIEGSTEVPQTPGPAEGPHEWCLWLGITNELTTTGDTLPTENQLVQYTPENPPTSFTHITCSDATRTCSTTDTIAPQPFPHQVP